MEETSVATAWNRNEFGQLSASSLVTILTELSVLINLVAPFKMLQTLTLLLN
jgi:hypothetical protein